MHDCAIKLDEIIWETSVYPSNSHRHFNVNCQ